MEQVLAQTEAAAGAVAGSFVLGFFVIWGLMVALGLALFIFWIVMIVDIVKRENWKDDSEKTVWLLIVILVGWLGALIYYFIIKKDHDKKKK